MPKPKPLANSASPDIDLLPDSLQIHPPLVPEQDHKSITVLSEESKNLITPHFSHFRDDPFSFLREISLHYSGSGWRAYNEPIGQKIFYKGFSEEMKQRVLRSEMLRGKIKELAEKRLVEEEGRGMFDGVHSQGGKMAKETRKQRRRREVEKQLEEVADGVVEGMICKFESKKFIRGAYFIAMQILARTYHLGIHVSTSEIRHLRHIAALASKANQSLIFLPCHRSHIDYVSLQVICYRLGLALPVVVAGDNLNFPLVGPFLQHAGAMYIRRSFGGDGLYAATVQAYVDALLAGGYNFECFIEGGRSRTGKLLPPKFGILSFILDSLLSSRVKDAWIIPVSTQYDKVIETNSYVNELLGIPKAKENLWDFLGSSKVLSLKMGRVDVRFHQPWSLRDFINSHTEREHLDPITDDGARLRLLRSLGYRVLSDINKVSVVMPTSLIGTVLLTLRGRGVGKSELVRRIDWLSSRIRAKGGRVADFGGIATETVVERGLEVLGDLVGTVDGLAEETFYAVDRFQLSFYRNMVIHLFISETVVASAMYTRVKAGGGPANQRIFYPDLFNQVSFLSQLFRGEFVFPTEGIRANLDKTLKGLEADGVINIGRKGDNMEGVNYVEISDKERMCGRENFDFYCFLIWPFIEGSWLAGVAVFGLAPVSGEEDVWVGVKEAQDMAQLLGKTLYHQGDLSYFEAVNKETLKNSFQRFEEEGIIEVRKTHPSPPPPSPASSSSSAAAAADKPLQPVLRIAPKWRPQRDQDGKGKILATGRLWEFIEKIAISRREGKNRRDNASVGTRVLGLSERLGRDVFDMALGAGGGGAEVDRRRMGARL
ncbi:hypothetical protein RUND412_005023 [Rhizina undulata]